MVQALEGQALPPLAEGESLPMKEVELHQVGQVSLPIKSACLSVRLLVQACVWPAAGLSMLLEQGERLQLCRYAYRVLGAIHWGCWGTRCHVTLTVLQHKGCLTDTLSSSTLGKMQL